MRIENNVKLVKEIVEATYKKQLKEIIEIEHWKKGTPIQQIAKKCNVNKSTLSYILVREGIPRRTAQQTADFIRNKFWDKVNKSEKRITLE